MTKPAPCDPKFIDRSRSLRATMTSGETQLWTRLRELRDHGLRFRRQHPVPPFILDFACLKAKIGVEIDGSSHEFRGEGDRLRDGLLESRGWTILSFSESETARDPDGVARSIVAAVERVIA